MRAPAQLHDDILMPVRGPRPADGAEWPTHRAKARAARRRATTNSTTPKDDR